MGGGPIWLRDVAPAAWIAGRLHPFGQDVGSVIPEGYQSYCRLFHPAGPRAQRWSEIARRNDRVVHPGMQFHNICRPRGRPSADPYLRDAPDRPQVGSLPFAERSVLVEILRPDTESADRCWFCMWDGFGSLDACGVSERVRLPGRHYFFYGGGIEVALVQPPLVDGTLSFAVETGTPPSQVAAELARAKRQLRGLFDQSPNLWWPDDRSWVVATEIDYAWTYVGGSRALVERILGAPRLEALPATLTDRPFHDSDEVNAALDAASG
jgi:hypothetical protein